MRSWEACLPTKCAVVERSVASYDNLYVRSLVGSRAFLLPAGALTRGHLEVAKRRLRHFTVVISLEDFDLHRVQLRAFLGWNHTKPLHAYNSHTTRHGHLKGTVPGNFTTRQLQQLRDANALDFELYQFALELAGNRTAAAMQRVLRS